MQLPLLCEKTGAIVLAQPGFTAGRLAGRQSAEILKIIYWMNHWNFSGVQKSTVS